VQRRLTARNYCRIFLNIYLLATYHNCVAVDISCHLFGIHNQGFRVDRNKSKSDSKILGRFVKSRMGCLWKDSFWLCHIASVQSIISVCLHGHQDRLSATRRHLKKTSVNNELKNYEHSITDPQESLSPLKILQIIFTTSPSILQIPGKTSGCSGLV
jgi:hypothetical protein